MINNCNNEWFYFGMNTFWWVYWMILILLLVLMLFLFNLTSKIKKDSSMDILRQKYALSEISTEEFEERKRVLKKE